MKKLFTFLIVFTIVAGLTQISEAQSPRMVVVEEATNASCPPCFSQNPPLQALLNQNTDKAIFIGYQVWWPGYDAMYLDNTTEVQWRIINGYYTSITGAPNIVIQGSGTAGLPNTLTQNVINNIYAETSEFDIELEADINLGMLNISGTITAHDSVSGDLRLRLILTEDVIYNEDLVQIGTNGETEFHHVFKKFIPGTAGIMLQNDWVPDDTYSFNETFDLSTLNIYHYDGLEVVAMIQNDDNKFIHQAAKVKDLQITVATDLNGTARNISGFPDILCSGDQTITPIVQIQNGGNETLTSLDITYDVNGGTPQVYNWTGSLSTLAKEKVTLDPITFTMESSNNIFVSVDNPNGGVDEDISDNTSESSTFSLASLTYDSITVEVLTDNYADEVYWEVRNSAGDVIDFGGNPNVGTTNIGTGNFPAPAHPDAYANATLYTKVIPIDATDCYTFHITDYYGDGVSLGTPDGYFRVRDGLGNIMISGGGNDAYVEVLNDFEGEKTVSVGNIVVINSFTVSPNPVRDIATLNFTLVENQETVIRVLNVNGQEVMTKRLGYLNAGKYQEELLLGQLNNGVYFVNLISGNHAGLQKVTVVK